MRENFRYAVKKSPFKNEGAFGKALGWSRQKMSKTVLGQRNPKLAEVKDISRLLGLPIDKVVDFFIDGLDGGVNDG